MSFKLRQQLCNEAENGRPPLPVGRYEGQFGSQKKDTLTAFDAVNQFVPMLKRQMGSPYPRRLNPGKFQCAFEMSLMILARHFTPLKIRSLTVAAR